MSELNGILVSLNRLQKQVDKDKDRVETLTAKQSELEQKIENSRVLFLEQEYAFLKKFSTSQKQKARKSLEDLCTQAIQYAMGPEYKVEIELNDDGKRKPTAQVFIINNKRNTKTEPLSSNGGGVVDVIGAAMQVINLATCDPFSDGPIIFDEPFKMLSANFVPMMTTFIEKVANDFGRQIIIVSHEDYLIESATQKITVTHDGNSSLISYNK